MLSGMFLGTSATARAPECEKNTGAIDTSMASHVVWSVRECEGDFKMQNRALLQIPWYITEYHRISQKDFSVSGRDRTGDLARVKRT